MLNSQYVNSTLRLETRVRERALQLESKNDALSFEIEQHFEIEA